MDASGGACVVFVWGAGEDGQLGLAEAPSNVDEWHVSAPTPVPALAGLAFRTDVACGLTPLVGGSRQSLCVTAQGHLFTWGWNEKQALGLGNKAETKKPTRVTALPDDVHIAQASARRHTTARARARVMHSRARTSRAGLLGRLARRCCDGRGRGIRMVRSAEFAGVK